jgi:hypothetical protein
VKAPTFKRSKPGDPAAPRTTEPAPSLPTSDRALYLTVALTPYLCQVLDSLAKVIHG